MTTSHLATCMSLLSTSSGLPGEPATESHTSVSATMPYNKCYNVCSENATVYCALQGDRCICFDTYVRSSVDQRECGTVCPGNCSQSRGGENLYSFHLNFLWLTPVEAAQCDGLPEPKVSNMLRSTTICFDYQNKLKLSQSSCPDGMRLTSHDPVCDPSLRKWVIHQRCYPIKCFNVFHIQHMEVQFIVQ